MNSLFLSRIKTLILLPLIIISFSASAKGETDQLAANAKIVIKGSLSIEKVHTLSIGRCPITFLQDKKGQEFVLKCNCNPEGSIHDALGAYVGSSIGIAINKVKIIPPHKDFIGRNDNTCVATLHTRVPGTEIAYISKMNRTLSIYCGLTNMGNLTSITKSYDLCDIVALDIFLDNYDRHNYNLFFNKKDKHFYGIDMDLIFSNMLYSHYNRNTTTNILDLSPCNRDSLFSEPIADRATRFLQELSKTPLSSQELTALKRVQKTLTSLIQNYPPKKIYDVWMHIAQKAQHTYTEQKKSLIQITLLYTAHKVDKFLNELTDIINQNSK